MIVHCGQCRTVFQPSVSLLALSSLSEFASGQRMLYWHPQGYLMRQSEWGWTYEQVNQHSQPTKVRTSCTYICVSFGWTAVDKKFERDEGGEVRKWEVHRSLSRFYAQTNSWNCLHEHTWVHSVLCHVCNNEVPKYL